MSESFNAGLIGFGNIGTGVVKTLAENRGLIDSRLPRPLRLTRIADVDAERRRDCPYDPAIVTADGMALIQDPSLHAIVELIGGTGVARKFVEAAIDAGKHVVTANKALLAAHGAELFERARAKGVQLLFEAAVGGGIPIVRALRQGLCANDIVSVQGIINGTCNYILTRMEEAGIPFGQALAEAQAAGYAEPDPTFDVEGHDTVHKIAILASLAFGMDIRAGDVWVEGIRAIQPIDIRLANELGFTIRLLGIAKRSGAGAAAEVRVHPTLVPKTSQLAAVTGVFNGILVDGRPIGPTFYYGRGAGADATSSAVIGDLMALAALDGAAVPMAEDRLPIPRGEKLIRPRGELRTHYYLRFTVADRPGVIARLSGVLAENEIGIESMIQHKPKGEPGEGATVTIVTYPAEERMMGQCLERVSALDINVAPPFVLRVEE